MRSETFDVILEVLTPLHIGTGQELHPDVDFVVEQAPGGERVAKIIDVDAALLAMSPDEIAAIREGRVAAALGERRRDECTRAVLPVWGSGSITRTRALQRLADGRPYIPGTTVKGSIRTALLQALANPETLKHLPLQHTREKTAAGPVEEQAFSTGLDPAGRRDAQFPNRDLNRAIRVSDFMPEGHARVAIVNISAHRLGGAIDRGRGQPIPIWCEAIEPGAKFKGLISIEREAPVWEAMNSKQQEVVSRIFQTWHEAGRRLLESERRAWGGGPESVLRFLNETIARNEVVVTLGWGGGWRSKTLAHLIPRDRLPDIAQQYGLRRWQGRDFPDRFPVTRKLAYTQRGQLPPGWVRVLRRPLGPRG